MYASTVTSFLALLGASSIALGQVTSFKHPGIHVSQAQIDEYKANALSGDEPWASAYKALLDTPEASPDYAVRGPGHTIGRGTGDSEIEGWSKAFDVDGVAAQLNGIAFSINGDSAHADKVAEIVDKWSGTLETVANKDNILVGWAGRLLANGAELVRYTNGAWPTGEDNYRRAQKMVSNVLVPNVYAAARPEADQPAAGGNQAILGHMAAMEFAIFTDNVTGFNDQLDVLKLPKKCENFGGSGIRALLHPETGQNAETGRDQAHAGMEVGFTEESAQVAANQGDYSLFEIEAEDGSPLILRGLEYYFRYNGGDDNVPFDTSFGPCCCGTVTYSGPSEQDRGEDVPFGEAGYRYYASDNGHDMPYTKAWLKDRRPVLHGYTAYGTLTFAKGTV